MPSDDQSQKIHDIDTDANSTSNNMSSLPSPSKYYVYPVRSLLSGIQPAQDRPTPPSVTDTIFSPPPEDALPAVTDYIERGKSSKPNQVQDALDSVTGSISSPRPQLLANDGYFSIAPALEDSSRLKSRRKGVAKLATQMTVGDRGTRKTVSTEDASDITGATSTNQENLVSTAPNLTEQTIASHNPTDRSAENLNQDTISLEDRDDGEYNPRHPPPIASVATDAMGDAFNPLWAPAGSSTSEPFNLSESGIVHLGSAPTQSQPGDEPPSGGGSLYEPRESHKARYSSANASHSSSRSQLSSEPSLLESEASSDPSTEPLVTFRYEHLQDKHGYHVVIGREGKLTKCEDEPIHAPGAVQGFGVLIAVKEDEETGNLCVRQVSENATELLGLSPRYLFSLECFTQTLPDSQADLLWDNVQFLQDTDLDNEGAVDESPQVFLLSGWGEPGSAISDDDDAPVNNTDRRFWTCWCAAHHPPRGKKLYGRGSITDSSSSLTSDQSLIILELELERDVYNPLYPPFPRELQLSGSSSPGLGVSPGGSSRGSGENSTAGESGSTTGSTTHNSDGNATTMPDDVSEGNMIRTPGLSTSTAGSQTSSSVGNLPPQSPINPAEIFLSSRQGLCGDDEWFPRPEDVFESTTTHSKPLKALERMRRVSRPGKDVSSSKSSRDRARARRGDSNKAGVGTMDIFAVLAQINDQLSSATDLDAFLKIVVGVIKDLTQFHRVIVYQFDEQWNGQVVAELVDWRQTHDLYKGLHFPAADIPAQARELYKINKVRLLYDRSQTTARLVVRSKEDLECPLDMTHSYLRAMSPIHIKYLANMGVRSSMSISIVTFGALWGLIACHSYGLAGMRVSFPVRQMLRLLSDSISRNVERLSYAQRLHTRKLISTLPTDAHPTGYIVSNAEDLLGLFDADFGVLVIGEGAKILGPNEHGQEILLVAEYLRLKQYNLIQVSQSVTENFPDLQLPSGLDVIAGLLYVPLSRNGRDFIAFLRKGQVRDVHWAGKPYKGGGGVDAILEPRKSFKTWSERIAGRCRNWTDEQMETAGVLALVYGKFIEVWRQKESAMQTTQLTNLLLSNASHEVRTPLNHIINYLEMALNGPLDGETRENLSRSHTASKSLLFTINDLLDLTRLESGKETSFNEPFDLRTAIDDAVQLYRNEALRRNLVFKMDLMNSPRMVVGDAKKIQTVVANLTANAVKYTKEGTVTISCRNFQEPRGLRDPDQVAVEIVVGDTGCGIESSKLESIFREFEQVESSMPKTDSLPGLGLGLAVVARIVEQLGGQLRVDSKPGQGSRFSFLIPFALYGTRSERSLSPQSSIHSSLVSKADSGGSASSQIDSIVEALGNSHMGDRAGAGAQNSQQTESSPLKIPPRSSPHDGIFEVEGSKYPVRSVRVDEFDLDPRPEPAQQAQITSTVQPARVTLPPALSPSSTKLRVLIVEDDQINRTILSKRLTLDGHAVSGTTNGQEGVEKIEADREFDCILMDIQMPILDGFEATKCIRTLEGKTSDLSDTPFRRSKYLNGRIPIFAVSASLLESQRDSMIELGMDGWILKPIDFKRLKLILKGILDPAQRERDTYHPGCSWEAGGWLVGPLSQFPPSPP